MEDLLGKYQWLESALLWIGASRVFLKPIGSIIRTYVNITPSQADNQWLDGVLKSKWWPYVQYALDWAMSLKLPGGKK